MAEALKQEGLLTEEKMRIAKSPRISIEFPPSEKKEEGNKKEPEE